MTEYFAVLGENDRRGPFCSIRESVSLLKKISRTRGHTDEQAYNFILHQSSVERVETVDGKVECQRVSWQAREESGLAEQLPQKSGKLLLHEKIARKTESDLADAHFTLATRKAAEVNEGGLVDPKIP
jgi:hypothetical protein